MRTAVSGGDGRLIVDPAINCSQPAIDSEVCDSCDGERGANVGAGERGRRLRCLPYFGSMGMVISLSEDWVNSRLLNTQMTSFLFSQKPGVERALP